MYSPQTVTVTAVELSEDPDEEEGNRPISIL